MAIGARRPLWSTIKEEADHTEKRVREVMRWNDLVEEKIGFVKGTCQNYEVLMEDKQVGKSRGVGPSNRYETRSAPK